MKSLAERIQKLHFSPRKKVINLLFGQYHSVFKGRGLEFEDLREYTIGDSIKDIDWKSTAKTGTFHVKKYQETRELHVLFVLDISSSMLWHANGQKSRIDQALDFITLVSLLSIAHNDTLGLLLFDKEVKTYIPFKRGNAQLIRILKSVDQHTQQQFWHDTNPTQAMKFLLDGVKKKTICFFITDSLDCVSHISLLRAMHAKHECVITYLQDESFQLDSLSIPFQAQDMETGETVTLDFSDKEILQAYEDYKQDIQRKKNVLKKNAIDLISLSPRDDITKSLYRFLHMQGRKRNRRI